MENEKFTIDGGNTDTPDLSALKEFKNVQDAEFKDAVENPEAKKRGRKKGQKNKPKYGPADETLNADAPPPVDFEKMVRPLVLMGSGFLVRATKCQEAGFMPEEAEALTLAWSEVMNAYAPAFLMQHGAIITACMVTASVGIRVAGTLENEILKRKQAQQTESGVRRASPGEVVTEIPQFNTENVNPSVENPDRYFS